MTGKLPSLQSAVRRGVGVTTLISVVQVVLQIVSVAALSRLLDPQAFGIVAAPLALANILSLLSEFGMGSNIVQRRERDPQALGTALSLILVLGGIGMGAMLLLSPFLGSALGSAGWAFALAAPLLLLTPIATCLESLCLRDLDYNGVLWSNLAASLGQALLPIFLALLGAGAVALVLAQLVMPLAKIAVLARKNTLPRPAFAPEILRDMMHFSGWFTLTRVFSLIAMSGDRIVLAPQISAASLGYYVRAQNFSQLMITLLGTSLEKVLFPLLASLRDERARMAAFYLDTLRVLGLVTGLAALAAALFSDWLIWILLGPGWSQAVPVAQIFAALIFLRAMDKAAAMLMRNHRMVRERALLQMGFAAVTVVAALAFGTVSLPLVAATIVAGAAAGAVYSIVMTALYLEVPARRAAAPMIYALACIALCTALHFGILSLLGQGFGLGFGLGLAARLVAFGAALVLPLATIFVLRRRFLGARLAALLERAVPFTSTRG